MSAIGMLFAGSSAPATLSPAACNIARRLELEVRLHSTRLYELLRPLHLLGMMQSRAAARFSACRSVVAHAYRRLSLRLDRVLWVAARRPGHLADRAGRAQITGTLLESSPSGSDKVCAAQCFFRRTGGVRSSRVKRTLRLESPARRHAIGARLGFVGPGDCVCRGVCKLCEISLPHSSSEQSANTGGPSPSVISLNWDVDRSRRAAWRVGAG